MYEFSLRKLKEMLNEIPSGYLDHNLVFRLKGKEGKVVIHHDCVEFSSSSIKEIVILDDEKIPSLKDNELLVDVITEGES